MRLRKRYLPLAALLGAAVAVLPSLASGTAPSTASFTASDFKWNVSGSSATTVTIAVGGTVTFSYPSGTSKHNADFGSGAPPTSCTQTAPTPTEPVPPLPHVPTGPGWSGSCTFNAAGTYMFHCDLHPSMTGTITVGEPTGTTTTTGTTTITTTTTTTGTTTTTTTTPPPTATTTTTPPPTQSTPTATQSSTTPATTTTSTTPVELLPGPLLVGGPSLRSTQRGTSVKGSLDVSQSGAGGRLEVDLLFKGASLAKARRGHRPKQVTLGRLVRTSVHAGRMSFSVALNARGKRALRSHHRLALTVKITLTPGHGRAVTVTRGVVLRV